MILYRNNNILKKALKRRVSGGNLTENPGWWKRGRLEVAEHGLGAAHRMVLPQGCDGSARERAGL